MSHATRVDAFSMGPMAAIGPKHQSSRPVAVAIALRLPSSRSSQDPHIVFHMMVRWELPLLSIPFYNKPRLWLRATHLVGKKAAPISMTFVIVSALCISAGTALIWWVIRHRPRYGLHLGLFATGVGVLLITAALTQRAATRSSPWATQLVVTAASGHWSAHLDVTNESPTSEPLTSIIVAWKVPLDMAAPKAQTYRVGSGFALWKHTWSEPVTGLSKPMVVKNLAHSTLIVTLKGPGRSQTIHLML